MGSSAKMISGRLGERACHGDALLLTTGELGRPVREPVAQPTVSMTWSSHASSGLRPASAIGSVMFSSAVSVGMRLYDWNTKPMRSRRTCVSCFSVSALRSTSPRNTWPLVRRSSPAMQCSSVDLPEPDGPMIAVYCGAAELDVDAVERADLGLALAVDLRRVDGAGGNGRRGGNRGRHGRHLYGASDVRSRIGDFPRHRGSEVIGVRRGSSTLVRVGARRGGRARRTRALPKMHKTIDSSRLKRTPKIFVASSMRSASNQMRPNVYSATYSANT